MKKLRKIVAAALSATLAMALPGMHMHADENFIISADDSRYKYLENTDGTISVAASEYSQTGISGTVTIPDKLDGKTVTGICKSGFCGRDITSVTVPQTVTSIGSLAFANCLSLTSVNLPKGITYMGELAFSSTLFETNLFKTSDPDFAVIDDYILYLYTGSEAVIEVPDGIKVIANSAFANNGVNSQTDITSITLPDGVAYIGDNVFENCSSLSEMTIRTGLESVGTNAISSS
ncbi:MAG: leucine-rich repeat domain-containing protein, partial [Porcipelethomonas sp.]